MPSFSVSLPVPPSWNLAYRIVKPRGSPRFTLAKTAEAWTWQTVAANIVQHAKPSDFAPKGQIRVLYDFYLKRSQDGDNLVKIASDGISWGLGTRMGKTKPMPLWDDRLFLPCVRSLSTGHAKPHMEVTLEWEQ